jgi:hypothetical protein
MKNLSYWKTYRMPSRTPSKIHPGIWLMVLLLAVTFLVQCGKKPGHDKTAYLLKKKLRLSSEQATEVESILNGVKDRRERDRKQYQGDNASLLKAARARSDLECEGIESILDEGQKARLMEIMCEKEVGDRTVIIAERLGLDRTTTNRIDRIVEKMPTEEEMTVSRRSGDSTKVRALEQETTRLHAEIESFLNDQQKEAFRKMVQEDTARRDQVMK